MARREHSAMHVLGDLALGAVSGAAASWVMATSQTKLLSKLGTKKSLEAEAESGKRAGVPATEKLVDWFATQVGVSLPDEQRKFGGQIVHYATGTAWGAIFMLGLAHRRRRVVTAALFGALLWLIQDETIVPLLGLASGPREFPASTHAKALGAHLIYAESIAALSPLLH